MTTTLLRPFLGLALSVVVAFSAGCVESEDELDEGFETEIAESKIRNNLPENAISKFSPYLNAIVTAGLGDPRTADQTRVMHGEPTGRRLIDYMVRCSLKPGQTLKIDGEMFPLSGGPMLGLAPDWATRGLTSTEQRWLYSCLLAHINTRNLSVSMSICGGHGALSCPSAELQGLDSEAVFFGRPGRLDNFDEKNAAFLYVAPAPGLIRACGLARAMAYLQGRECSRGSCEHLTLLPPAEQAQPAAAHSCDPRSGLTPTYFQKCGSHGITSKWITDTNPDRVYSTALTTYMDLKTCPANGL